LEGIVRRISGSSGISVTGPLGIASMAGEAAKEGLWSFLSFLALINLHLGILNLFPFPALDGGRLALVVAEMIFRRRIPEKWEQYIHFIGFILLLSLLAAVTWKDLVKILTREGN
jgi:regulator of sigma E protease